MKKKTLIALFLVSAVLFLFFACDNEQQDTKKPGNEESGNEEPGDGDNKKPGDGEPGDGDNKEPGDGEPGEGENKEPGDGEPGDGEDKEPKTTFIWTFQKEIPGWKEFINESGKTGDYPDNPEGTTMKLDANYYGMALLASQRTTRWRPNDPAPADTDFSDGYIMPNGRTNPGAYSLKIENVKGPFTLTINYTARETQESFPIIYINGTEKKRGEQTTENAPKILIYEYEIEDTVTISLGNDRTPTSSSAGIKIWDVILYAPENAGEEWGDDSGSNNSGNGGNENGGEDIDNYTGNYPENWPAVLAFPGAEGFGRYASGGRGGKVAAVTNTLDTAVNPPEGSLRWALSQYPNEPLTVVFRISGLIQLEADLRVKRDNFTLAGQTSPGGICVTGGKVNLGGSNNVIVRHLRIRIGNGIHESAFGMENSTKFIIDHCSFGWSGEENMTVYDNDLSTVQWCVIHEGLFDSGHAKGDRGYGVQWGGKNATYHHNLLAHNDSRSPRFNGARSTPGYPKDTKVMIDFVNNVNFNWGRQSSIYGADITHAANTHRANFTGNYWKPGPAYPAVNTIWFISSTSGNIPDKKAEWWMSGNIMEGKDNFTSDNFLGLTGTYVKAEAPFEILHPVTVEPAQNAYESVLERAGAFPRDSVDARIVGDVRNPDRVTVTGKSGRRGIIDQISSVGGHASYNDLPAPADTDGDGIPDDWETAKGLNPNDAVDGNLTTLNGPYTNLEVYLNELEEIIRQER